jgi:amidase
MVDQARRNILSGVTATAPAVSTQKARSIPASECDYCAIKELTEALHARRISASELLEHAMARIEALDERLNAIVRDFERARETAKAVDIAIGRCDRQSLLGIPTTSATKSSRRQDRGHYSIVCMSGSSE